MDLVEDEYQGVTCRYDDEEDGGGDVGQEILPGDYVMGRRSGEDRKSMLIWVMMRWEGVDRLREMME